MADRFFPTKRRLIQLYSALLYNAHIKGFINGEIYTGPLKNACVPGLNCYSCPGAVGSCPLGALQNALATADRRMPFYIIGIIMLTGLIFGRTVCGFLCPFGFIQDILDKVPFPKIKKGRFTRALSHLKYAILAVFVIILPLYNAVKHVPLPAFCKYICPAGTLEGALALLAHPNNSGLLPMLGALFTNKLVILILILVLSMFAHRFFCRFLCPLGALYGCFNRVALLGVQVDSSRCTSCGKCCRCCGMDTKMPGDRECIQCGHCIKECPTGAISWKCAPKKQKTRRFLKPVFWICALLLLAFTLFSVNTQSAVPDVPTGSEVGQRCPDFSVKLIPEGEYSLSRDTSKAKIINFWATWCAPCCRELPYFDEFSAAHPDVNVIAIHSELVTEDVEAFIENLDIRLLFALDENGSIMTQLGGSTMLPMTVVLDKNNVIVYSAVGSMTYEKLEEIVLPLLK